MTSNSVAKRTQVLLYCPKLPNEHRRKPLLLKAASARRERVQSIAQGDSSTLLKAWQKLKQIVDQSYAEEHTAQPAFSLFPGLSDSDTLDALSKVVIISPEGLNLDSPTDAINWLTFQYEQRNRLPKKLYAIGFKRFWRSTIEAFCQGSELIHVKNAEEVPAGAKAITWGLKPLRTNEDVEVIRLEDGFLRSVGLGIQFARPLSWIPDRTGMYFDVTRASDLEQILNQIALSDSQVQQVQSLIKRIVKSGITKYNVGKSVWQLPDVANDKHCILVTGQVESDASIHFGAPGITTNAELVKAVRARHPESFIVYKPHPDVVSKSRAKGRTEDAANQYADLIVTDASISQVMTQVDEVHVLTSLAGFEALLRNIPVTCYGVPFFSGWGLTTDMCNAQTARAAYQRRQQALSVEALVHGALCKYPLYVSRKNGYYGDAHSTLEELIHWRESQSSLQNGLVTLFKKFIRRIMNLLLGAK